MRADLRAAIYVRVSTPGQAERGTSLASQEQQARAMCERHGWDVVAVVADRGISGRRADRPGIATLLTLAREGRIDVVVPASSDRFGRSLLDSLLLQKELDELGVAVLSVDGRLDSLSDRGRFTSTIWGAIAEEESRTIARRTSEGRRAATREGRFTGSTAPWGWQAVPSPDGKGKRLVVDPIAATSIRRIVEILAEGGITYGDAARQLTAEGHLRPGNGRSGPSPWAADTLRRWVRTRGLSTADATWSLDGISVSIPPVLDREQAEDLRRLVEQTPAKTQRRNEPALLQGRITAPCGAPMHARIVVHPNGRRQRPVYSCSAKVGRGRSGCGCANVPIDWVDAATWHQISQLLTDDAALAAMARETIGARDQVDDLGEVEAEIDRIRTEITQTHQAARARGMDPITALALLEPMQAELTEAQERLVKAQRRRSARAGRDRTRLRETVRDLRAAVVVADDERRRELLAALDARVQVETHSCEHCQGSGYMPFTPGGPRRRPEVCPECERMRISVAVIVEVDDVAALTLVQTSSAS